MTPLIEEMDPQKGNLASNGDDPYRIINSLQNGAYKLGVD